MQRIKKIAYVDFSTNPERYKHVWTYKLNKKSTEREILSTISYIKYARRISRINKKFLNNKKFLLKALKINGLILNYLDAKFRGDKEIVMAALYDDPTKVRGLGPHMFWDSIDDSLKEDEDIILTACKNNSAIDFVPQRLLSDKKFILKCAKINGNILKKIDKKFCDDEEIVTSAVKENGFCLQYVSQRLRENKKIVLNAISKFGHGFEYVSDEFKSNKKFIIKCLKKSDDAFQYLNEKDRGNEYFASLACYRNGYSIQFASERIRDNKRIALYAVNSNPFSYNYLSKRLKKDKEIIKAYKISKKKEELRWKKN
jgi:hypothetical protein